MSQRRINLLFITLLCFGVLSVAYAQDGPGSAKPSGNGGSYGGPGMAGATGNGSINFGGGREIGQGRGEGLSLGGERPAPPSGGVNRERGQGLFGGEGMTFERPNLTRGEGTSWAEFGGFGAGISDDVEPPAGALNELSGQWNPSAELPTAPASMAEIEAVITAQAEAISEATGAAQDAAQAAYDQFWGDYYAAVDYAADAYYAAVGASTEIASATYEDALAQTTEAIDYYLDYAAEYAEYCYYYPWDCYSYAYNAATDAYEYIAATSGQPAGTMAIDEVSAVWPDLTAAVPSSSAEAYEVLVVFANDQLGMVVQPLYAGTPTEEIALLMHALPSSLQAYITWLMDAQAYWGIISGGAGVVALGDCSAEAPCTLGDIPAALSNVSGGVYMLAVAQPMPGSANDALNLVTNVYPALNGLAFSQITGIEGFGFMATAYGVGAGAEGTPLTVAKLIYAGALEVQGQTIVYAMVAVGEAQIDAFYSLIAGN